MTRIWQKHLRKSFQINAPSAPITPTNMPAERPMIQPHPNTTAFMSNPLRPIPSQPLPAPPTRLDMSLLEVKMANIKIQALENCLDQLQTELWDTEEHNKLLIGKCQQREIWVAQERSTRQAITEENQKTTNELCEVRRNLTYAQNHVKELNTTIELAKKEMEKIRAAKVSDEHLARKLIELHEANQKLVAENKRLNEENLRLLNETFAFPNHHEKMTSEVIKLEEEIKKYQTQTTRLIAENAAYSCQGAKTNEISSMCGGCTECQLKQTKSILNQTASNLADANKALAEQRKTLDERANLIATLNKERCQLFQMIKILEAGLREISTGKQWFGSSGTIARSTLAKSNSLPGTIGGFIPGITK